MILVSLLMIVTSSLINGANSFELPVNFSQSFEITWGRALILNRGQLLNLNLDKASGSAFQSKFEFLFGRIDMQILLVPGNSAGTVTAFNLASKGKTYDEVEFKFLGNSSGQPYTVQTNVVSQGKGDRVQQFRLWFDPTKKFNTYSIFWNRRNIIFYVNNIPIRVFNNKESQGVPFPSKQAMRIYSSISNGESWATRGGLVKTDWAKAPFSVFYRNYKFERLCLWLGQNSLCDLPPSASSSATIIDKSWLDQGLDPVGLGRLKMVRKKLMIYDYCNDRKRFPRSLPRECK